MQHLNNRNHHTTLQYISRLRSSQSLCTKGLMRIVVGRIKKRFVMNGDDIFSRSRICGLFSLLFLLVLLFPLQTKAQDQIQGPATGTMDSKAIYANPAIISFQNSQIALGMRGYHLGFFEESGIGYRQGFISGLIPRVRGTRFGAGTHLQYFDSPIFRTSQFGIATSYRILNGLSAGVSASFNHISFNRDNFVGFDFEDPVFQDGFSKFSFNAAAGVYYRPLDIVELAVGARNLTEPNLSLVSDNVTEPREYFSAVSLRHQFLKGTLEFVHGRFGLQTRTHAELFSSHGYYVRTGTNLNFDSGYLEAQAHIANGFSVNYQFELPLNELSGNSSGSHMISLVYEFNKIPGLPGKPLVPVNIPGIDRPQISPEAHGNILLSSQTDHLMYHEKQIVRRIDLESISSQDLEALSRYDIGGLGDDPQTDRRPYESAASPTSPVPESVTLSSSVSQQYRDALVYLAELLESGELEDLRLLTGEGGEIRAAGVRNQLHQQSGVPVAVSQIVLETEDDSLRFEIPVDESMFGDEQIIEVEPATAVIRTIPTENLSMRNWTLRITDRDQNVVKNIRGQSTIPEVIEWDWITDNGQFIDPGVYDYALYWTDTNGNQFQSNKRSLYVQKVLRKITIDITKDLNKILENPDKIDIILKNN